MDNKGAVDLANNWSVGGRTRHVDVRNHFLRDLKDEGLLITRHVPGDENDADIFTKNVTGPIFQRHLPTFVGTDKYMEEEPEALYGVRRCLCTYSTCVVEVCGYLAGTAKAVFSP